MATPPVPAPVDPPPLVPAWARPAAGRRHDGPHDALDTALDAALCTGACLAALDAVVRRNLPCAGAWRHRLALEAATHSIRRSGRSDRPEDLRDAWFLRRPGDALGPAGEHLAAWRFLSRPAADLTVQTVARVATHFGLGATAGRQAVVDLTSDALRSPGGPLTRAARLIADLERLDPHLALLGLWLADLVLATSLRWPVAVPLIAAHIDRAAIRSTAGAATRDRDPETHRRLVLVAVWHAAAAATDLAATLFRRTHTLLDVAPKLRAKGAGAVVTALLDDDAIAPAQSIGGLSDRAMRRLCERLVTLGAVRELTQRASFRLYGL